MGAIEKANTYPDGYACAEGDSAVVNPLVLCQVTSRKKRVFSSNLQTFITAAWTEFHCSCWVSPKVLILLYFLHFHCSLLEVVCQNMPGEGVERNCGKLDTDGLGI